MNKEKEKMMKLRQVTESMGKINPNVQIDDTNIDLTDTPANVLKKIKTAMNVKEFKADYKLTEHKIDKIRSSNM